MSTRREFLGALLVAAVRPQQPPTSAGAADPKLIEDVIIANRILAIEGVLDAFGHVTVRHNRNPNRFLMSRSLAPALITADDLIEYDLDGNAVNTRGRAEYSERFIHAEVYRARPDVNSVAHSHAASVIPFGVSSVPLRPVYHMAGFITEGIPIFDIRKAAGMTDMLVKNSALGRALAETLGKRPAVLMRGHGMVAVGPGTPYAVGRSIYLEMNARIQSQAMNLGGQVTYLDIEEARKVVEAGENRGYERAWELWKQKVSSSK
jgi:HCOMODA/2-hydroxy-3-carboxy-muconic semialdehyde decarboxylase